MTGVVSGQLSGVRSAMEQAGHKTHAPHPRVNDQGIPVWMICCQGCGARTESVLFTVDGQTEPQVEVVADTATAIQCPKNPEGRRYYL